MAPNKELKEWPKVHDFLPGHCQRAYKKPCDNVDIDRAQVQPTPRVGPIFLTHHSQVRNKIWQYNSNRREHKTNIVITEESPTLSKTFENRGGVLTTIENIQPPTDLMLAEVVVGLPRKDGEGSL